MTPDEMRARAQECEEQAKQGANPTLQEGYKKLARQWRELAEQMDRQYT